MQKKDQLDPKEIIQGPYLEARGGWKGSRKDNEIACKMDIRLGLIWMKDLCKGSEQYLTFPSNHIAMSRARSWKTYRSRSKSWR